LGYHARYSKYHRNTAISIVRVLCHGCGITHALIPSFSLPGSSHDTGDVEQYLAARELGQTRGKAGAHFLASGRSLRVLKRIERSFARCMRNWSAIFAMAISTRLAFSALAAMLADCAVTEDDRGGFFFAANRYALDRRVNAVFASRSSILLFRARKAGRSFPRNLASVRDAPVAPDSS